jgi:glycine/D-amino acid oxidase-like deaminating enzyme
MGMLTLNHVLVHLRNNQLRVDGGLRLEACAVSEEADFVDEIPAEFAELYTVVPQARIRELLETDDDRYRAVLSDRKGCSNSGMLCQQVLAYLERRYPDRLHFTDQTEVERVVVGPDGVELQANGRSVRAARVVLCTNGYTRHVVEDEAGTPLELHPEQRVVGTYGFMAAFAEDHPRPPTAMSYIRNQAIGSGEAGYVYITRRTYDRPGGAVTLTCMGGPEWPHEGVYDPWAPFPGALLTALDTEVRAFAQRGRPAGQPYDFHWHGLMGYMDGMVRVIGVHPGRPSLLYNLGCNGVGFLPSIHGGRQIALLLAGEQLAPSIFDPR